MRAGSGRMSLTEPDASHFTLKSDVAHCKGTCASRIHEILSLLCEPSAFDYSVDKQASIRSLLPSYSESNATNPGTADKIIQQCVHLGNYSVSFRGKIVLLAS